ncbi:MAG TPA: hypothetical protein VGH90_10645, partial [Chthoniobacteraceae bacterium]
TDFLEKLRNIVRATESFRAAEKAGALLRLPTGDGGALVFRDSPDTPVICAVEIARNLRAYPGLRVRMGIHSGPIKDVTDLNESANIAGAGINIAQRVMDCGDSGHILLSKRVADDLEQYARWRPLLHELGNCEVKHGLNLTIFNLFADDFGNPQAPTRFLEGKEVGGEETRSPGSRKSIAVLPFQSLSEDKANTYFADGIQEEVLTRLSQIGDLKVISRTSTQQFRDSSENIREIARQLGVVHILEGSVQKADRRVRVHVQLIDATRDSHVWAERYDRDLVDIFAVESDIASKIAEALEAKLTGAERRAITHRPTTNTEAHEYYLRGQYQWRHFFAPGFQHVRENFEKAIELDPSYAPAYAGLGLYHSFGAANAILPPEDWPPAERAVEKAVELDPNLAEAYNPRAAVDIYYKRDWAAAESAFRRGAELNKNLSGVRHHYGLCLVLLGRADEGLAQMEKASLLDPFFSGLHLHAGRMFFFLRDYDEAIKRFIRTLELQPDNPMAHEYFGDACEKKGMTHEAVTQWRASLALTGQEQTAGLLEQTYASSGFDAALRLLGQRQLLAFQNRSSQGHYIPSWSYAIAHMRAGDQEAALGALAKVVEEPNWFALQLKINPLLDPLRGDPRFAGLASKIHLKT